MLSSGQLNASLAVILLCFVGCMSCRPHLCLCRSLELRSAKPTLQCQLSSQMQELALRRCELLLLTSP